MINSILKSILFLLGVIILTFSFLEKEKSLDKILRDRYIEHFTQLQTAVSDLEKSIEENDSKKIKKTYFLLRHAYKKTEPLFIYFDPDAVKKDLNGAPLLKLEENSPGINILEPKGLQVIDELIGMDELNVQSIKKNLIVFNQKLEQIKKTLAIRSFDHRMAIELYQLNLVKLFTLEQSGFDTPGTLHGLKDSKTTFIEINQILKPYLKYFINLDEEIEHLKDLMNKGEGYFSEPLDFERFDRAKFLTDIVEPIFALVNKIHSTSGIEYYDEVSRFPIPLNVRSNHIFSTDFLNEGYFSGVDPKDEKLIELGKLLFYDPILSKNNKRACASCHQPDKGFTDNLKFSPSFDFKGTLNRNSSTVLNAVYASDYFWDLRAQEIRNQIEHVVFNSKEFASGFNEIENKLKKSKDYVKLFEESFTTFNGEAVNKNSIEVAITAFVQSLQGWNSEFDKFARGENNELSESAKDGFNLFMGKAQCGICHFPPTFSGLVPPYFKESESEVLGMTTDFDTINPTLDSDIGRAQSSKIKDRAELFKNSIKTPTIRNAELTFPYMHNGAFTTLEEVIHFYNHGGGSGLGLTVENQTLPDTKLRLSSSEMTDLKAFILSLTDTISMDLSKPTALPYFGNEFDQRVIGGEY